MAMRGRPCGRRRLTRPAKLRKRIISPPRHGGKASVWRDRSAIPRAPRPLFRFGNVGSLCQTPPCRRVPNRSRVLDRTPHCYSLLFSLFFIVICAGGKRRAKRAKPRGARRNSPLSPTPALLFIVINNAAVRERRAQQQADSTTSAHKSGTRCRSGQKCFPASSPGSAPSYSRCQTARSRAGGNASSLRAARDRRPSGIAPGDHVECESF
jgi:hypothetical protein